MPEIIILKGSELEELLPPKVLVEAIGKCFKMLSEGNTVTPPRTVMWVRGNWWGIMQSYVPGYGVGVKVVNVVPENRSRGLPTIQALVTLYDEVTGSPLAVLEGAVLTALRTAAASALSIKYSAPKTPGPVAVIGTGYQARYQLRFALEYFKATEVRIYDVREEAMRSYAEFVRSRIGLPVIECSSPAEAVKGSRLVIEATTTKEPVVLGKYLEEPVHVVSIGAHTPDSRALDDEVFKKASFVIVDSKEAVMSETGDIIQPVKSGLIKLEDICELGELVSGKCVVRGGIVVYKSVGVAVQDACAASLAYKLAKEQGVGTLIKI